MLHLNYQNPHLSPFDEFQRFKTHPFVRDTFEGGKRLAYGARAITEGGFQSVPKLVFPGGALIGCAAGFVNVPRIKGSHNAILSGMQAAEQAAQALSAGRSNDVLTGYQDNWKTSEIGKDLWKVRNAKPLWSRFGTMIGIALGGLDMWTNTLLNFSFFGTLGHGKKDAKTLKPAAQAERIVYPKPRRQADLRQTVFGVSVEHQSRRRPAGAPEGARHATSEEISEHDVFGGPSPRYCPAGVYEWVEGEGAEARYVINAQNCVHCKTCDIKDPNENITWVTPEGGGGPNYPNM